MKRNLKMLLIACLIVPVAIVMVACGGKATTKYTITATPSNAAYGSVTGAGKYKKDAEVTLTAIPASSCVFVEWKVGTTVVSADNPYKFDATKDISIVAMFATTEATLFTVATSANDSNFGTVEGGGNYGLGASATLTAIPTEGYQFVEWKVGESVVSNANPYTFSVTSAVSVIAVFETEDIPLAGDYLSTYARAYGIDFDFDDFIIDPEYGDVTLSSDGEEKINSLLNILTTQHPDRLLEIKADLGSDDMEDVRALVIDDISGLLIDMGGAEMCFAATDDATGIVTISAGAGHPYNYEVSGSNINVIYDVASGATGTFTWDKKQGTITLNNPTDYSIPLGVIFTKVIA